MLERVFGDRMSNKLELGKRRWNLETCSAEIEFLLRSSLMHYFFRYIFSTFNFHFLFGIYRFNSGPLDHIDMFLKYQMDKAA